MYSYIISSTKLKRILETYKDAKRLYFKDIADIDKEELKEKEEMITKITQEKSDLEAKYKKTKTELEKRKRRVKRKS